MTLEQIAEELEKIYSVETLNMLAEHFPKCFEYEVRLAKRFYNEPENNIVTV